MANDLITSLAGMSPPVPNTPPVDPSQLNALQNLGIFEGRPVEDRNKALLLAGLGMMQPTQWGGALPQLSQGITAGLGSLESDEQKRLTAAQQGVENRIAQQQADAGTTTADARVTTAKAAETTAQTGVSRQKADETIANKQLTLELKKIQENARQFDENWGVRIADEVEKLAHAAYWDRMPTESQSSQGAEKFQWLVKSKVAKLWDDDRKLGRRGQYLGPDDPQLIDAANTAVLAEEGAAKSPNTAVVADTTSDAQALGQNLQSIANPALRRFPELTPQEQIAVDNMDKYGPAQWAALVEARSPALLLLERYPRWKEDVKKQVQQFYRMQQEQQSAQVSP